MGKPILTMFPFGEVVGTYMVLATMIGHITAECCSEKHVEGPTLAGTYILEPNQTHVNSECRDSCVYKRRGDDEPDRRYCFTLEESVTHNTTSICEPLYTCPSMGGTCDSGGYCSPDSIANSSRWACCCWSQYCRCKKNAQGKKFKRQVQSTFAKWI